MLQFIRFNMQEITGYPKDFLTNCYTRDSLNSFLGQMESGYKVQQTPFSVFIIDVDHFKFFNDKYGHLCGDEVLKYFSSSIRLDLEEETNYPFRFGGDEFIVVFPGKTAKEVYPLADRLQKNVKTRPCLYKGRNIKMGFSGGIACYPDDTNNIEDLLEKADKALYASKKKGRGRVMMYGRMKAEAVVRNTAMVFLALVLAAGIFLAGKSTKEFFQALLAQAKTAAASYPSALVKKISSFKLSPAAAPPALPFLAPPTPFPPPAAKPRTPAALAPVNTVDIIHFKSGRVLKGQILSEDSQTVRVETKLSSGKGSVGISKSDILKIERGTAA